MRDYNKLFFRECCVVQVRENLKGGRDLEGIGRQSTAKWDK